MVKSVAKPGYQVKHQKHKKKKDSPPVSILPSLKTIHPSEILLIFGTGFSSTALPAVSALQGWRPLVQALIQSANQFNILSEREQQQLQNMMRRNASPVAISDRLFKYLTCGTEIIKGTYMEECINHIFGNLGDKITRDGKKLYTCLWKLLEEGTILMSSNLDTLFESFVERNYGEKITSLDWTDTTKITKWSNGKIPHSILHVHGLAKNANSVILTSDGYEMLLKNGPLMAILEAVMQKRICLIIGKSLSKEDKTFQYLLDNNKSTREHYYFVKSTSVSNLPALRSELFSKGIKIVPYGSSYQALPNYLERFVKSITSQM